MGLSDGLSSPPPLATLLAGGPTSLFLDFDGTLVDIAPAPDAIVVREGLAAALDSLASRLEQRLALVSGRSLEDIASHLGTPQIARAGSHGAARMRADGSMIGPAPATIPEQAVGALKAFTVEHGIAYESKTHGGAIHYRSSPEKEDLAIAFATELAEQFGLAIKRGKCVVELVRPGASKGDAVHAFMCEEPFARSRPIFIGDDVTDEDGFAACQSMGGLGILVGERTPTLAQHSLPSVRAVHQWLEFF